VEASVSTVATYVERNTEQRERLQRLVERLSDDDLLRDVPDTEWSISDTLAHLAFYDRRAQILLEKFARDGVSASPYDFQTLNDALPHLTRLIPPRAIAEEAVAAAVAADAAAEAISDALLAEIRARNEVNPDRAVHRQNHLDDIEPMLASS
jgi:uncharacterized damage-inducible protein DinB